MYVYCIYICTYDLDLHVCMYGLDMILEWIYMVSVFQPVELVRPFRFVAEPFLSARATWSFRLLGSFCKLGVLFWGPYRHGPELVHTSTACPLIHGGDQ